MKLKLEGISISLGKFRIVDFSIEVPSGSFTSIVGPSGCGKTTLLRIIAGLEMPEKGKVFFDGEDVTQLEPENRDIGMVFQGDSLFSHLDVFGNVAFGPRMKKEIGIEEKVARALKLVHLSGMEKRKVDGLSGGERKRVAIARAIAFEPRILLLDEPLSGLDAGLKEKMKALLNGLQQRTGLTTIMVTHDIDEAFFLSDRIAVMGQGKLEQIGPPIEIFKNPKNDFVKAFVSDYFLAEGRAKSIGGKRFAEGKFLLPIKKYGKGKVFLNLKKNNFKFVD